MAEKLYGYTTSGLFGYSHMAGGYAGGQAQYARVPFVDVGALKVPDGLTDEQVLFLSDIFPTGYMGAENCNIQPGHVVAPRRGQEVSRVLADVARVQGVAATERMIEELARPDASFAGLPDGSWWIRDTVTVLSLRRQVKSVSTTASQSCSSFTLTSS